MRDFLELYGAANCVECGCGKLFFSMNNIIAKILIETRHSKFGRFSKVDNVMGLTTGDGFNVSLIFDIFR